MKVWRSSEAAAGFPAAPPLAHLWARPRPATAGADNERVLRYLAKVTAEPAIVHGVATEVGSLLPGRLADVVLWSPAWFGVKPELVLKSGHFARNHAGDAHNISHRPATGTGLQSLGWPWTIGRLGGGDLLGQVAEHTFVVRAGGGTGRAHRWASGGAAGNPAAASDERRALDMRVERARPCPMRPYLRIAVDWKLTAAPSFSAAIVATRTFGRRVDIGRDVRVPRCPPPVVSRCSRAVAVRTDHGVDARARDVRLGHQRHHVRMWYTRAQPGPRSP